MEAVTYILTKDINIDLNLEEVKSVYTENELSDIYKYAEIIQRIKEINSLFDVFRVNFHLMHQYYEFGNDDFLINKRRISDDINDDAMINALIISFISAGRTVVEAIEGFSKEIPGKDDSFKKECLSTIYDKFFSYRFLCQLRNFAQHGHLPVSVDEENLCYFDLHHILGATHFNHNAKLKKEMKRIQEIIFEEFSDYPHLNFTRTLAEYNLCVVEIYKEFLVYFEKILLNAREDIIHLIKRKPEVLHNSNDIFNGYLFYWVADEVHCLDPNPDPMIWYSELAKEILGLYHAEKVEFEKLVNSVKKIKRSTGTI